jgi:hypothetical protein
MAKFSGGCLCGSVHYSSEVEPVATALCHCKSCQRQSGTAFSTIAAVPRASLKVEGTLGTFNDRADSGKSVIRHFCPKCGSALISDVEVTPDLLWIKAGTLDDSSAFKPQMHIWCSSAQPWFKFTDGLPQFPQNPPIG